MAVDFRLDGRVAVITGSSRGIGEAIARTFAAYGAKVVVSSRKQDACEAVAASIKAAGGEATAVACHTGSTKDINVLFEKTLAAYGRVDVLVNNAATNPYFGDVLHISESQFDKTFEVNTKGYFFTAQKAATIMAAQHKGCIINIASIAGLEGPPMQGVYGMTKAAVILMTKAYAKELGAFGIRSNAICPGLTETKFAKVLIDTPAIHDMAVKGIPLGRHGQPDEMAGAALWLASDAGSFTNGAIIVIDGGATC